MAYKHKLIFLSAVLVLLGALLIAMQLDTGSIAGVISDEYGPIPKASVEARNIMTAVLTRTESNSAGQYKLDGLHYGRYSLWVRAPQHSSNWILEVIVEKGEVTKRDVHLTLEKSLTSFRLNSRPLSFQ